MKDLAALKKKVEELKGKRKEVAAKSADFRADKALKALAKRQKRAQRKLRRLSVSAKKAAPAEQKKGEEKTDKK